MENVKSNTADRELVISRVVDAPRELVYEVWISPEHVVHWWGPNGFSNTNHEMDVRPGGVWRYTMHAADGTNFPNKIMYREVIANERLEYDQMGEEDYDHISFQVTVTFEDVDDKTRITMRSVFPTTELRNMVVEQHGAIEGGKQNLRRLDHYIQYMCKDNAFTISRTYNVPVETMFKVHSKAEHLTNWWGPVGLRSVAKEFDFQPGGVFLYGMETPDGNVTYGRQEYVDIVPNKMIVFVNSFADEGGNIIHHPGSPEWPAEMLTTITFEPVANGTKLTIKVVPIHASDVENRTFLEGHTSMQEGFGGSLGVLGEYLQTV